MKPILILSLFLLGGCRTTTKQDVEAEFESFNRICDERLVSPQYFYEVRDRAIRTKNADHLREMWYIMGLRHGCISGVMEYQWFRDKPPVYGKEGE